MQLNLRKAGELGETQLVPTSCQRIMRVTSVQTPTFWSITKPVTNAKRGVSCYRSMTLPLAEKPKDQNNQTIGKIIYQTREISPQVGHHSAPKGTEFVALQKQIEDDPALIALCAHQLRLCVPQTLGEISVKLPAPLHILGKLADYMGLKS